jgi:hypothetical protein
MDFGIQYSSNFGRVSQESGQFLMKSQKCTTCSKVLSEHLRAGSELPILKQISADFQPISADFQPISAEFQPISCRFSADFRAICCTVSTGFPVV